MAQLKDLIVYGDTKFLGDVTLDHDPTANLHAATKAYVDAQVGTGTDEKLKVDALTSGTTYYPILAAGTGTATRQADTTGGGFTYKATLGTSGSSTAGTAILQVGNSLYVGQVNNLMGVVRIYESGSSGAGVARYTDIRAGTGTANNTIYLPYGTSTYPSSYLVAASQRGTAIGSTTQPVYVNSEGFIEACTGADTKVSLTSTTTSASYPLALGPTSITSGSAYGEYYNTSFYVNPSTLVLNTPKLTVNGGVSSYTDPVQVYTTGATNYIATFRNNTTTTSSTTYTYGVRIYAPNMVASTSASYANFAAFDIGVSAAACNSGNMVFHYSGSGSTSNFIGFGLYSHNNILAVAGTDRVGIMNTAPSYTLDVTGTIHASVGVKIGTSSEIKSIGSGLSVDADGALYATNATTGTVTGSGISGYLAKWTGTGAMSHELTVGPMIGTGTTKFLREDGTWQVPSGGGGGTTYVYHGTCETAAATVEKAVTCSEFTSDKLVTGATIFVTFTATNSAAVASITLNVNGTGAKNIKYLGNAAVYNLPSAGYIIANMTYCFVYNGTYWIMDLYYNTNDTGIQIKHYYMNRLVSQEITSYKVMLLDKDGKYIPYATTSGATTYTKTINTTAFNPFAGIFWKYADSTTTTNTKVGDGQVFCSYTAGYGDVRYSFNINSSGTAGTTALTSNTPIFIKAKYDFSTGLATLVPDSSSSNYLERSSIVQALPTTNPNDSSNFYIYIYFGNAYDKYRSVLSLVNEVYAWNSLSNSMTPFTGAPFSGSGTFALMDSVAQYGVSGTYYKNGKTVTIYGSFPTGSTAITSLPGLPFAPANSFEVMLPQYSMSVLSIVQCKLGFTAGSTSVTTTGYTYGMSSSNNSWINYTGRAASPFMITYVTND